MAIELIKINHIYSYTGYSLYSLYTLYTDFQVVAFYKVLNSH